MQIQDYGCISRPIQTILSICSKKTLVSQRTGWNSWAFMIYTHYCLMRIANWQSSLESDLGLLRENTLYTPFRIRKCKQTSSLFRNDWTHSTVSITVAKVSTEVVLNCTYQSQQQRAISSWERGVCERDQTWAKLRRFKNPVMLKDNTITILLWRAANAHYTEFVETYIRLNFGKKNATSQPDVQFFQHSKSQRCF